MISGSSKVALDTIQSGVILDILQISFKTLKETLIQDIKFIYDIFYAGLRSPVSILVSIYKTGLVFFLKVLLILKLKMGYDYLTASSSGPGSLPPPPPPAPSPRTEPKGQRFKYNSRPKYTKARQTTSVLAVNEQFKQHSHVIPHPVHVSPPVVPAPHLTIKNQSISITIPSPVIKRNLYSRAKIAIRNIGLCFALVMIAPERLKEVVKPSNIFPTLFSKSQALISFILMKPYDSKIDKPTGASISTTGNKKDILIVKENKDVSKGCTFLKEIAKKYF